MLAVVLSGGGAKGAYEVGVWKALRKLKIKYDIITGTSIGAINGMMMMQNDFYKTMYLWKNINFDQLYDDFSYDNDNKKMYKSYIEKIIQGGIDTSKIEKLISDNYKPNKIYNSKKTFGIVSFNVTTKSVVNSTNKNTRPDKLKKYILASATCFPAFKPTKIGAETFIDGGYYDNLPINLAIDLGADEVIAVDLGAVGLKKHIKNKDIKITYIKPSSKLEKFFMFEATSARKMINLGYNDTMKVFKKLEGNTYTFKKGTIDNQLKCKNNLLKIAKDHEFNIIRKLEKDDSTMCEILEEALEILEMPVEKIYDSKMKKLMIKKLDTIESINLDVLSIEELKKIFDKKAIVKYIYTKLEKCDKISIIANLFPKEFVTAMYLRS